MKLLILGGTIFMGRHLAGYAIERGHEVTLFTRGRHNPDIFPEAHMLHGHRDGDLAALEGGRWDAVIDTCGFVPRVVRQSAQLLKNAVGHYTFISTISVYPDFKVAGIDETAPVAVLEDPTVETVDGETYGGLKALCETVVQEELPGRCLIVRPGLMVGPFDPTDRFTWWPVRVARGGEMLAPVDPERRTQIIDARDLAFWLMRLVERGATGVLNATGPDRPLSIGEILEESLRITRSGASLTWVPESFLTEQDVTFWSEIPLLVPGGPDMAGFADVSIARAVAEGLRFRPLAETIRDTFDWNATLPADRPLRAGLAPDREAAILVKWREASAGPGVAG